MSSRFRTVTVFMEDSPAIGAPKAFGPAALLRACVADTMELEDQYALRDRIAVNPVGPNSEVIKRMSLCAQSGNNPWPAIFTLDRDRLPELLADKQLQDTGCLSGQRQSLRDHAGLPSAAVVLIGNNLEDVLRVLQQACQGVPELMNLDWEGAIGKKQSARDSVLNAVAGAQYKPVRDKARKLNLSLQYLVQKSVAMLQLP